MYPIDGPAHDNNTFTEGDPVGNIPATRVTAQWLNTIQAEILNVLDAANITPSKANQAQLLAAIQALAAPAPVPENTQGAELGLALNAERLRTLQAYVANARAAD